MPEAPGANAGGRAATDLLQGAGEEVDEREPEDQGEHPPLPQKPAPHHGRQVHHAGADAGRGGRGAERDRAGVRAAWPLHSRQPHLSRRAPGAGPAALSRASYQKPTHAASGDYALRPASTPLRHQPTSLSFITIGPCEEADSYWLKPGKGAGSHVRAVGVAVSRS